MSFPEDQEAVDFIKEKIPLKEGNNKYTEYLEKRYDHWFCINHNRYFKTYLDYKQHCNSMHRFKCEKWQGK